MRYMFWAEKHKKLPKGTAEEFAKHTKSIKSLPEKVGTITALRALGLDKLAEELKGEGIETRLKRNHEPYDFYGVRRGFKRADKKKQEVGQHVQHETK